MFDKIIDFFNEFVISDILRFCYLKLYLRGALFYFATGFKYVNFSGFTTEQCF